MPAATSAHQVKIPVQGAELPGSLELPEGAKGLVVFVHGSGSSRHSPRNMAVASLLREGGLGTLLFDLLTLDEESLDRSSGQLRFNIGLLTGRLVEVTDWLCRDERTRQLCIGYFGASTGAAAALMAAAERPGEVGAVVSRGGRPDLAGEALPAVEAPTLLIVGGADVQVLELNRVAIRQMEAPTELEVVPGATHLFEEPGALEHVARLALDWFQRYLEPSTD
jgi:putative phosphoribosyl transferase